MSVPERVVIDVSVPSTADVEAVATVVDVVADPAGATVILVPTPSPGPQGAPGGDLTPEQRQELVDDVEAEVLAELEPAVNLVIRFRNIRSQG